MAAKTFFVFCTSALLVQSISAQFVGNNQWGAANLASNLPASRSWAGNGCGGVQAGSAAVGNGGGFTVSSTSPIAPTGVTVVSENALEGPVEIVGQLPVLSAVALEGPLATGGAAGASYSCGNGEVGITADSLAAAEVGAGNAIGAGLNEVGAGITRIGAGINGIGAGINGFGSGISNAGLRNAGIGNVGLTSTGLNSGLAGSRLSRPGFNY